MANNRIVLTGLTELRAALRQLPSELAGEAADVVERATTSTAETLRQQYPVRDTGNLRRGVKASVVKSATGVLGTVKSTAPHAVLWEFGTQIRATRQGWNRGKSPSHHMDGLIPIAQRERRRMHVGLVEIVARAGFEVTGAL